MADHGQQFAVHIKTPQVLQKDVADARKTLERASARILREHRESLAAGKGDGKPPGSFIDLLVNTTDRATGEPLPDEGIVEQVLPTRQAWKSR